jgi:hypothetical protein
MMNIAEAIAAADALLPGLVAPDGEVDPRWRAIIAVGEHLESHPHEVWQFVVRWGSDSDPDLQSAVATCLLEHLLEYHFALLFPKVRSLAESDRNFASTFLGCWKCGQANEAGNREEFEALSAECRQRVQEIQ